ncbi:MAG: hypothetical protein PUF12_07920, partial [Thermoflexaceae bacterium]|nr:hypothetical protein [Thermoflexaceae bacterium]
MKGKMKQRVMAVFMALLMTIGLLPADFLGGGAVEVQAAGTGTYTFDVKANETTYGWSNNGAIVAETASYRSSEDESYTFKVEGSVKWAKSSTQSIELTKARGGALEFTVPVGYKANVVVSACSTGGEKTSNIAVLSSSD